MKSRHLALAILVAGFVLGWAPAAIAQGVTRVCVENVNSTTGANNCQEVAPASPFPVTTTPSSSAGNGIPPIVSASAEATHVLKASPGNLYSVYATNLTATAGFLVTLNATTVPVDGAITPLDCAPLPGNSTASINYRSGPPEVFSTGIVAVVTSANTCFTKTTGVITGFIHGDVQ